MRGSYDVHIKFVVGEILTEYILSVVGVVFLGVLIDVILPEGEMNKYIKGVFAVIALFVMISPVQKIFDKDFNFEDVFYNSVSSTVDEDFIIATNKQIVMQLKNTVKVELCNNGFENVNVEIECDLSSSQLNIKKVTVDISKMVINTNVAHINKYTEIKKIVAEFLNVEESDVEIDG